MTDFVFIRSAKVNKDQRRLSTAGPIASSSTESLSSQHDLTASRAPSVPLNRCSRTWSISTSKPGLQTGRSQLTPDAAQRSHSFSSRSGCTADKNFSFLRSERASSRIQSLMSHDLDSSVVESSDLSSEEDYLFPPTQAFLFVDRRTAHGATQAIVSRSYSDSSTTPSDPATPDETSLTQSSVSAFSGVEIQVPEGMMDNIYARHLLQSLQELDRSVEHKLPRERRTCRWRRPGEHSVLDLDPDLDDALSDDDSSESGRVVEALRAPLHRSSPPRGSCLSKHRPLRESKGLRIKFNDGDPFPGWTFGKSVYNRSSLSINSHWAEQSQSLEEFQDLLKDGWQGMPSKSIGEWAEMWHETPSTLARRRARQKEALVSPI